mmetsp:Transcript_28232/g.81640  ORF Transcript_28232/g.81640 Transcript_28232/m.81640 type:complete len:119 (-) Transcript_28232:1180-1536(-)|eukprot:CAMPEP_0181031990 /NCGR_PEP_ID=MMETSP1070-20121207/6514_1 /TAXON_ID=265543 /ORGANISM="Minutocellus polymorphus, Strain NH13" /LENGTH=118 /DNA_ID=CAMNT_0023109379 /DNA_START=110 /DNA_END=466 /DNA_ORIENTATION=+
MEDKIAKLEAATSQAEKDVLRDLELLSDATERVRVAKALLKQMPQEDQEKIPITDTKLPELLDLLATATENYETSQQRYQTNKRYLEILTRKMGASGVPADKDDSTTKNDESTAKPTA